MRRPILALFLALPLCLISLWAWGAAPAVSSGAFPFDPFHNVPMSRSYVQDNYFRPVCGPWYAVAMAGSRTSSAVTGTSYQESERFTCTNGSQSLSRFYLVMPSQIMSSGIELNGLNVVCYKASIEYNNTVTYPPKQFTRNGQSIMCADPSASFLISDPYYLYVAPGAVYYLHYTPGVVWHPNTLSAAAVTGSGLAASQAYYFKATCVKYTTSVFSGIQSGPTSEATATTGASGTLAITLTWTASPSFVGCDAVRIYMGTSSNGEAYLTTVAADLLTYTVTSAATVSGIVPPSVQQAYIYGTIQNSGVSTSSANAGGNQGDYTTGTGAIAAGATVGPTSNVVAAPMGLFADDNSIPSVCLITDSKGVGSGIQIASNFLGTATGPLTGNYFAQGLSPSLYNVLNVGLSTSTESSFLSLNGKLGATARTALADMACKNYHDEEGVNDLAIAGMTWQQLVNMKIALGTKYHRLGRLYFGQTLTPYVTSTDLMTSYTGQTPSAYETSIRVPYNTWYYNGRLMNAGQPCNTPNCGPPTTAVDGYWDAAGAAHEVNSAGVLTQNGGFWPVFADASGTIATGSNAKATAIYTGTLTGTPTYNGVTFTGTTLPYSGSALGVRAALAGYSLLMTSGTQNGKGCVIGDNNPTTTMICSAASNTFTFTGAPASGDTFALYATAAQEGIHESLIESGIMAASLAPWAAAHFKNL